MANDAYLSWLDQLPEARIEEELTVLPKPDAFKIQQGLERGEALSSLVEATGARFGNRIIPVTRMDEHYRAVRSLPEERAERGFRRRVDDQQDLAERLLDSGQLADDFIESIRQFSEYWNVAEPFLDPRESGDWVETSKTRRVADKLEKGSTWKVRGHVELDFRFVDRELPPARTTSRARFRGETKPRKRFPTLDLLLAGQDRWPVFCELKVAEDENPFYALIQALGYSAQLLTEPQRERLALAHGDRLTLPTEGPFADIYLMLVDYEEVKEWKPPLGRAARKLAGQVMEDERVRALVRRIACLEASELDDPLEFTRSWHAP